MQEIYRHFRSFMVSYSCNEKRMKGVTTTMKNKELKLTIENLVMDESPLSPKKEIAYKTVIQMLEEENADLKQQLANYKKLVYGQKSEKSEIILEGGEQMETVGKEFVRDELVYVPARLFVRKHYGAKGENIAYHAYQSFKPGEVTPEQCHEIGVKLAEKLWGNRYQVLVATHTNCSHLHKLFYKGLSVYGTKPTIKSRLSRLQEEYSGKRKAERKNLWNDL